MKICENGARARYVDESRRPRLRKQLDSRFQRKSAVDLPVLLEAAYPPIERVIRGGYFYLRADKRHLKTSDFGLRNLRIALGKNVSKFPRCIC